MPTKTDSTPRAALLADIQTWNLDRCTRRIRELRNVLHVERRGFTDDERAEFHFIESRMTDINEEAELARQYPESRPDPRGDMTLEQSRRMQSLEAFDDPPVATSGGWVDRQGNALTVVRSDQRLADVLRPGPGERALDLGRLVRCMVTRDCRSGDEAEFRALSGVSLTAGGVLVPTALAASVIDMARAQSVAVRAGASMLTMDTSNLTIARVDSDPVPAWRGENQDISEDTMTFGGWQLTARSLGVLVKAPYELIEDSPNAGDVIRNAIAQAMALSFDYAALAGTGSSLEPLGIVNTPDVQEIDIDGRGWKLDDLSEAVELIATQNGTANGIVYGPRMAGELDRAKDGKGEWLLPSPAVRDMPKYVSTQIPQDIDGDKSFAIVADFRQLLLAIRHGIRLEASTVANDSFAKGQVHIRALLRADVALARPSHFVKLTNIAPLSAS